MSVTAVVGAQFGSEGKGLIVERMCQDYEIVVRTGAPNAGHTYYVDRPRPSGISLAGLQPPQRVKVVARSVPVGAAFHGAELVVGVGAFVDIDLLLEEVTELDALGLAVSSRLKVDSRATLIDARRHRDYEGGVDGEAHRLIGSTGEGVGPARMGKLARGTMLTPAWARVEQVAEQRVRLERLGIEVCDTALWLNDRYDRGDRILLEGTQGSGLSLTHGPWPYVTSTDTNAGQLATDAGLAPQTLSKVVLVARTFPIRVAGNSGPLPMETTWQAVGQPEEYTTVTKKPRRVGRMHAPTVQRAAMLNRPDEIALTFIDYVFPELSNQKQCPVPPPDGLIEYLEEMRRSFGAPIRWVGTGPDSAFRVTTLAQAAQVDWPSHGEAFGLRYEA